MHKLYHSRSRIHYSLVRPAILNWFDTWQPFLTLLALWTFFGFILPLPIIYFAMLYNSVYGYLWGIMWIAIAGIIEYREELRREKAMTASEYVVKPNAAKEYVELMKKHKKG
jgi:hypothetical protein